MARAPVWLAAQDALGQLSDQSGEPLENSQQVTEYMQQLLDASVKPPSSATKWRPANVKCRAQIERLQPAGRRGRSTPGHAGRTFRRRAAVGENLR